MLPVGHCARPSTYYGYFQPVKKRMAQPAFAMVLLFAPIWATAQDEPTIQAPLHPPAPTEISTKESDVLVEAP